MTKTQTVYKKENSNYVKKISESVHSHTPKLIKEIIFYCIIFGLLYLAIYVYNKTLSIMFVKCRPLT